GPAAGGGVGAGRAVRLRAREVVTGRSAPGAPAAPELPASRSLRSTGSAMDRTLKGGTDAAGMVVFDPAALPDDFDEKQNDDPVSQLEQLMQAGRLYWIETHADGSYTLGVYVGHSLPDRLRGCEPFDIRPVCSKPMGGAASDVAPGERAGG